MIPNIFVSSTIEDLHHLRDAIRDTLLELAHNPVMSEYGDIGYLPTMSAEDSCYITMRQCQIAVIIIGKRYGYISANNLSVSHNEFKTAREHKIPVICLVDQEVWSYKRVFDANKGKKKIDIPGMDAPDKTFAFLQSIIESPLNNGILPFSNVASARHHLKTQLAHIFGDLLNKRFDPIKADVMDVLSEIKTLRHELKGSTGKESLTFLKAIRFLLDENSDLLRSLIEQIYETVDQAIPALVSSNSFNEFIEYATGRKPKVVKLSTSVQIAEYSLSNKEIRYSFHTTSTDKSDKSKPLFACVTSNKEIYVNPSALKQLEHLHHLFKNAIAERK